jgi:DNA repair protein RadC
MSLHDKHRQRLDKKAILYGFDMLEPHEQLEELLFQVIPRGDTNAIAHRLLERFVTIRGVINADVDELEQIKGVGHRAAMFLTSLPKLLGIIERNLKTEVPPKLRTTKEIANYVKTYFYGRLIEETYIFSLNFLHRT